MKKDNSIRVRSIFIVVQKNKHDFKSILSQPNMKLQMYCKGICSDYAVKKPNPKGNGRYESGQKRCSLCEIYLILDGDHCPCCGCTLRSKPRNNKSRNKLVHKN